MIDNTDILDVIGVVQEVYPVKTSGYNTKRNVQLTDESGATIMLTVDNTDVSLLCLELHVVCT